MIQSFDDLPVSLVTSYTELGIVTLDLLC